jgi:hypothetical protein
VHPLPTISRLTAMGNFVKLRIRQGVQAMVGGQPGVGAPTAMLLLLLCCYAVKGVLGCEKWCVLRLRASARLQSLLASMCFSGAGRAVHRCSHSLSFSQPALAVWVCFSRSCTYTC